MLRILPSAVVSLLCLLLLASAGRADSSALPPACHQLLLVTAANWNTSAATLQRYNLGQTGWKRVGHAIPVRIGRNGLAWGRGEVAVPAGAVGPRKREGDGRAPAGVFSLGPVWLRPGIPALSSDLPQNRVSDDAVGVDDPKSKYYNQIVRKSEVATPDWNSGEDMTIPEYDRVLVVHHNTANPVPGGGSCIFMHTWTTPQKATSGCTAMTSANLTETLNWLRVADEPRLVQLPEREFSGWLKAGRLPPSLTLPPRASSRKGSKPAP